jgi:hypothetical protein
MKRIVFGPKTLFEANSISEMTFWMLKEVWFSNSLILIFSRFISINQALGSRKIISLKLQKWFHIRKKISKYGASFFLAQFC